MDLRALTQLLKHGTVLDAADYLRGYGLPVPALKDR